MELFSPFLNHSKNYWQWIGKVLVFFAGAEVIPPLGFSEVTLNFNHANPFPTASTCGLTLILPTKYTQYESFKNNFMYAITNSGGFGLM